MNYFTLFLILIVSQTARSQIDLLELGSVDQKNYHLTIPYTLKNGKIVVEVGLLGKIRKFILDTGAPTILSERLFNEISPKILGSVKLFDQSGAEDSVDVVNIPSLKISDLTFHEIPAIISKNAPFMFDCFEVDGYIGSNLLQNSIVQICDLTKTVTLSNQVKKLKLKRRKASKIEIIKILPHTWIQLAKDKSRVNELVLFDTGDDAMYVLAYSTYQQIKKEVPVFNILAETRGTFSAGMHGFAVHQEHVLVHIPFLKIGELTFTNITARSTHSGISRIGSTMLKYGKVTVDYINNRFYFEAYTTKKTIDLNEKIWPIDPSYENDKLIVGTIWDKSLESQLNLGDEIITFDDFDYRGMNICQIMNHDRSSTKDEVTIRAIDKYSGIVKTVLITKKAVF